MKQDRPHERIDKTDQLEFAALRRQRILDFLLENPSANMTRINAMLRSMGDKATASNTIATMTLWGEVRTEGAMRTRKYYALTATTRSANQSKAARTKNAVEANKQRQANAAPARKPTGYVHHCGGPNGSGHPIPNQGGQGALRRTVTVNCGQNYEG